MRVFWFFIQRSIVSISLLPRFVLLRHMTPQHVVTAVHSGLKRMSLCPASESSVNCPDNAGCDFHYGQVALPA